MPVTLPGPVASQATWGTAGPHPSDKPDHLVQTSNSGAFSVSNDSKTILSGAETGRLPCTRRGFPGGVSARHSVPMDPSQDCSLLPLLQVGAGVSCSQDLPYPSTELNRCQSCLTFDHQVSVPTPCEPLALPPVGHPCQASFA